MVADLLKAEQQTSSHPLLSSKKCVCNSNCLVGMEDSKQKKQTSLEDSRQTQVKFVSVKCLYPKTLTQYKTRIEIWDSKVSLLALLSFPAWETHLQDPPPSPPVLIHRDIVSFLLFFHSYFTGTSGRGLSAGAKNAASAKTPVGTNVTSEITSLLS